MSASGDPAKARSQLVATLTKALRCQRPSTRCSIARPKPRCWR